MNAEKTAKRFMQRVSKSCTGMNPQREFELLNQLINIIEAAQHGQYCPYCNVGRIARKENMANCNCGAKLEYGHVEVKAGENADTLDVWYEKCAGVDGFWCGYYRVFDNPPNTVCTPTDCGLPAPDSLSTPAAISG